MFIEIKNIKNILLDLGGVICDLDWEAMRLAFERLSPLTESANQKAQELDLYIQFEKGLFSKEEFIDRAIKVLGGTNTKDEVVNAWNAILANMPESRLNAIKKLRERYPVYLLSNTNIIHHEFINRHLISKLNPSKLEDLFDKCFMSYELGLRKPELQIYQEVLSRMKCKAEEVLFIDDDLKNVEAATKLGIQSYFLDLNNEDLTEALIKLNLI